MTRLLFPVEVLTIQWGVKELGFDPDKGMTMAIAFPRSGRAELSFCDTNGEKRTYTYISSHASPDALKEVMEDMGLELDKDNNVYRKAPK